MHPDHARSFVLANSRGASLFARQSTRIHVCEAYTDTWRPASSPRRVGFAFGRVRTTSSGVLNILRIPFARYLALFQDTTDSIHQLAPHPPLHPPFSPAPPPPLVRDAIFCCSLHNLHYSSSEISGPLPAGVCQLLHTVV